MRFLVEGLAVGFGGRAIQSDLSFALPPGERIAVAGPSGCGKSSLLRTLAMLDAPVEGIVTLGGRRPAEHGYPVWRRRVLYVAQRATFFGGTVRSELERPFGYLSAVRPFDRERAVDGLARVGLGAKVEVPIDEVSEGERQRVALVRAVLLEPDVLLLDEPTSALDTATTARVEEWLDECASSIVMVTHDDAQRARLCSNVLVLEALDG